MKKWFFLPILSLLLITNSVAQKTASLVSGPMIGHTELRSTTLWMEFSPDVSEAWLKYAKANESLQNGKTINIACKPSNYFNPSKVVVGGLDPGTTYQYQVLTNKGKNIVAEGKFTTQSLWQWRTAAPDFSFIAGSCAYFNEPQFDRPGRPYGGDSSIFETMAKEKADFMLWLGDNWYTREVDFYSTWGLQYRASRDRAMPILQPLLKSMAHYAIWDDHDYGPNNSDKSYSLKEHSKKVFDDYWANPSSGFNGNGIYTTFQWNDVDVFLLDDRWERSADDTPPSFNGKANEENTMIGKEQMKWLKQALLFSNSKPFINFRFITIGTQVLNPVSPYETWKKYQAEYLELINFIKENKINGVVFLTGDRHHSEIIKVEEQGMYPLYDITSSPLTSGTHSFGGAEANNPYRVLGIDKLQNYTRFSFTGKGADRRMLVSFLGIKGETIKEWSITAKELSFKK